MAFGSEALDAAFATFGVAASYAPAGGGSPVACTLVLDQADAADSVRGTRFVEDQTRAKVRASEIAAPAKGDTFTVGAVAYTVAEKPHREDRERLVWRLLLRAEA